MVQRFDSDVGVYGVPGDVTPFDIRFDPTNRTHVDREVDGSYTIRAWAEPELTDGLLVAREAGQVVGHPMHRSSKGGRFVYWQVSLAASENPIEFSLAFRSGAGLPVYRVPAGISSSVERLDRWKLDGLMEPFATPAWAHGAVIYQIFPDRFANGDSTNDPIDVNPWNSPPAPRGFWGGDLAGIQSKLGYLEELGIDLIYLNPIFRSPSNHRYDTIDYYQVDPMLGTNQDLKSLIDDAHGRGIRVMIDASFNHVHPQFFAFQDLIENGPDSEYTDWFVVNEWPVHLKRNQRKLSRGAAGWLPIWVEQTGLAVVDDPQAPSGIVPSYDTWYGVATMPRVNLANPEARQYMLDVAAYWITQFSLDGWRMDVARYVDPDFWNDFRKVVKAANPNALLLAEVMGDASDWLQGDRFDATMNYTFRDVCLGFFAHDLIDGRGFLDRMGTMLAQYGHASTVCNQNLIGSHDTARFLTESGGERWRLDLATVCQLTVPGSPSIYYGDEIGLEGGTDPGSRGTFPWSPDPTSDPTHQLVQDLARLRRRRPALRTGTWHPGMSTRHIISYERRLGKARLLIIMNRGRSKNHLTNDGWSKAIWGSAEISEQTITIPARRAAILSR